MNKSLNIVSYNLHKGRTTFNRRYNIDSLKKIIAPLDFDIGFFQEVLSQQHSTVKLSCQLEALADDKWKEYSFAKNSIVTNHEHGNAILSKFPIVENHIVNLTINKLEKRSAIFTKIAHEDQHIICICTHLNLRTKDRLIQVNKILEFLDELRNPDQPELVIFAGDFNDWSSRIERFLTQKGFQTCGEKLKTFPSQFPRLGLDKVFYLNHIQTSSKIGRSKIYKKYSDHLPLFSTVVF